MLYLNTNQILNEANVRIDGKCKFNFLPDPSIHGIRMKIYVENINAGEIAISGDYKSKENLRIKHTSARPRSADYILACYYIAIAFHKELQDYIISHDPNFENRLQAMLDIFIKSTKYKPSKPDALKDPAIQRYLACFGELPPDGPIYENKKRGR